MSEDPENGEAIKIRQASYLPEDVTPHSVKQ
jgi:hypothetical protein